MPVPSVGSSTSATTAGDIILSIRSQIPDPVADPQDDGGAFSYDTLRRWINDAMRIMATSAPIIQDWYAFQSQQGMDLYELPNTTLSVEQLWYDLQPCVRLPEAMTIDTTKITAKSYFFGPHSIHAIPRLQVWPAPDRTGATTTLTGGTVTPAATQMNGADTSSFKAMGFFGIGSEIVAYRTNSANTFQNLLRGQAGTAVGTHTSGTTITERNVMLKLSRLPNPILIYTDPVEIPLGLTPLIELYVLAKVREAEQESVLALQMRTEFNKSMEALQAKAAYKGLRQGLQVSSGLGPELYGGRVFIP